MIAASPSTVSRSPAHTDGISVSFPRRTCTSSTDRSCRAARSGIRIAVHGGGQECFPATSPGVDVQGSRSDEPRKCGRSSALRGSARHTARTPSGVCVPSSRPTSSARSLCRPVRLATASRCRSSRRASGTVVRVSVSCPEGHSSCMSYQTSYQEGLTHADA